MATYTSQSALQICACSSRATDVAAVPMTEPNHAGCAAVPVEVMTGILYPMGYAIPAR